MNKDTKTYPISIVIKGIAPNTFSVYELYDNGFENLVITFSKQKDAESFAYELRQSWRQMRANAELEAAFQSFEKFYKV